MELRLAAGDERGAGRGSCFQHARVDMRMDVSTHTRSVWALDEGVSSTDEGIGSTDEGVSSTDEGVSSTGEGV